MRIKKFLYADTHDELSLKAIGLHHDHCYHLYWGPVKDVPNSLLEGLDLNNKYVLIYEE